MKIVLVHPAGSNWVPGKKDVTAVANRMAPLGILSIAAYLKKNGHDVVVHDCLGPHAVFGTSANGKAIIDHHPDIVGFSATTSGFLDGYELATYIKNARPHIHVIFGGVHVSALGGVLLENFENIDSLAVGEGEITFAELASGLPYSKVSGLIWRDGDTIMTNPHRRHIENLDDLPFPAYEMLRHFPKGYQLPLFSYIQAPGATMVTSRGCPFQCSYCDRSVFKQGFRYNSPGYIYSHIKYLKDRFGVRHVNIYDDLFTLNRRRIGDLCRLLTENPLGVQFNCAVRVGHADHQLLGMLRRAGCLMVSIGIETGDAELLKTHKPGVYLEEVRDTVNRIKSVGLRAKGLFMMGLPGDTEASIRKTSDFVMSLGLDDMNMAKFTPFHGAPVWKDIPSQGTFKEDWRMMNCLNFVFIPRGIASKEALDQLYNTHVKRFYSDKNWRRTFMKRIWQHRRSLWYFFKHLPDFMSAMRAFEPASSDKDHT